MATLKKIAVSELAFDRKNARIIEFPEITSTTPEDMILEILWDTMDVRELVMSIASGGFFEHEPLIVAVEDGKNVVIEGNRRLAAVRSILNPNLIDAEIPTVTDKIKNNIRKLPVVISTREAVWQYLGFKHINGPARWGSYAKAKYIAQVRKDFNVSLDEIARQIGDTNRTVHRLFRALMVIEQAEKEKIFSKKRRQKNFFLLIKYLLRITIQWYLRFPGNQRRNRRYRRICAT